MATSTDLVNIALSRIGAKRIDDLQNGTTVEAIKARDVYDEARRDLLSLHTWNFATKRAALTESGTAPTAGFDNTYILPDDFIRMISVHPSDDDRQSIEYRLEFQESDDRVLLCDATTCYVRYVFDLEDVNLMPAYFRDALAWRLAFEFAASISKASGAVLEVFERKGQRKLSRAKAIDGIEDWPDRMAVGSWVTDRLGVGTEIINDV